MSIQFRIIFVVTLAGRLTQAYAQVPIVSSVLNAASFVTPPAIGHALAPGSLASIFGQNLAAGTVTGSPPYGTSLGGASVTVSGILAPLLYVSATQINFQVPSEVVLPVGGSNYTGAPIVVSTGNGVSAPFSTDVYQLGPGIFTVDGSGCGQAAILNVRPGGSISLNSPSNSAAPGDYLEIFGTGLGPAATSIADGFPSPAADPVATPTGATLGTIPAAAIAYSGAPYAGWAPGLVGVDQVNIQVPQGVEEACSVPLLVSEGMVPGQIVPVSIHTGAGACVDPPQQSSGQISLQRTIFPNSSQPETDTLTASFSAFPTGTASAPVAPSAPTCYIGPTVYHQPPNSPCGMPGVQPLNVGAVTIQGQGLGAIPATTATSNGSLIYTAAMPTGSIQQGTYAINVGGAGGVGPFQTAITTGAPIQITSQFASGATITSLNQLVVNWTGGDDSEIVIMRLVDPGQIWDGQLVCTALGSAHSVQYALYVYPPGQFGQAVLYYPPGAGPLDIIVDVVPASVLAPVAAPGLTNGVSLTWIYEYRFTGLQVY